jgi:succinate dehydrogenase / fumarate reductase membrane anchor subunit
MSLRSPLGKVLGLGAAKEGVEHWWSQRVSAVGVALLGLWFLISLVALGGLSYDAVLAWLGRPVNAALLVLLIVAVTYHSKLGVQVVLEDYVSSKAAKVACLVANQFIHIALAAIAIFAVLRAAFGIQA